MSKMDSKWRQIFATKFCDDFIEGGLPRFQPDWKSGDDRVVVIRDLKEKVTLAIGIDSVHAGDYLTAKRRAFFSQQKTGQNPEDVDYCCYSIKEGCCCTGDHDHETYSSRLNESKPTYVEIVENMPAEMLSEMRRLIGNPIAQQRAQPSSYKLREVSEMVPLLEEVVEKARMTVAEFGGVCCGVLEVCVEDMFVTEDVREACLMGWMAEKCRTDSKGRQYVVPKPPTGTPGRRRLCQPKELAPERVVDLLLLLNRGLSSNGRIVHSVYGFSLVTVPVQRKVKKPGPYTRFLTAVAGGVCDKHGSPGGLGIHMMCLDSLAINMLGTADFLTAHAMVDVVRKEGLASGGLNSLGADWEPVGSSRLDAFWLACHCLSGNRWSQAVTSLQHKFYEASHFVDEGPVEELMEWADCTDGSKYCQTDLNASLIVCCSNLIRKFKTN
uniref:RdRp n=1 Tax=Flavolineata virus TaxID=2787848 RepID=A0A7S8C0S0_9VIRU|nr:RdRp [Flavolineata virus]